MSVTMHSGCGTYGGWQRHQRRGEEQCQPCLAAHADYKRSWRRRTGRTESVLVPVDLLRRIASAVPEPLATQVRSLTKEGDMSGIDVHSRETMAESQIEAGLARCANTGEFQALGPHEGKAV